MHSTKMMKKKVSKMQCDDCEIKCRSSDECGAYQDLEGEYIELKKNYYWLLNAYFGAGVK